MNLTLRVRAATLATAVLVSTKFYQINKLAGYLLYPYVGFLIFANALNISIATKNQNVRLRWNNCAQSSRTYTWDLSHACIFYLYLPL